MLNQVRRVAAQLIGQQQRRLFVAEVHNCELAQFASVIGQRDALIDEAWGAIGARDTFELDTAPAARQGIADLLKDFFGAPTQGDTADATTVQVVKVGIGGELRIEDQLFGQAPGALLPEIDKAQDLVILLLFADIGVGTAEHAPLAILRQESEHALLTAAALGDVVLLDQGVFTVKGDSVEIQVLLPRPSPCPVMASNQCCMNFA